MYTPFTPIDEEADVEWADKYLVNAGSAGPVWDARPKPNGAVKVAIELMSLEEWAERYWEACEKDWSRELQLLCDGKNVPMELQYDHLTDGILFQTWCLWNIPPGPDKPPDTYHDKYIHKIV